MQYLRLLKRKKEKKLKRRKLTKNAETKLGDSFKNKKNKTMIDIDRKECNSIKSIALKVNMNINVTSRFIIGKMLMLAEMSLKYFVYDMTDAFWFPAEEVKLIYDKYYIIECYFTLI